MSAATETISPALHEVVDPNSGQGRDQVFPPPSQSKKYRVNKTAATSMKPTKIAAPQDPPSSGDADFSSL
jgi:hypothetical protein